MQTAVKPSETGQKSVLAHSLTVHDANNNLYRTDCGLTIGHRAEERAVQRGTQFWGEGRLFPTRQAPCLRDSRLGGRNAQVWQTFSNMSLSCVADQCSDVAQFTSSDRSQGSGIKCQSHTIWQPQANRHPVFIKHALPLSKHHHSITLPFTVSGFLKELWNSRTQHYAAAQSFVLTRFHTELYHAAGWSICFAPFCVLRLVFADTLGELIDTQHHHLSCIAIRS